MMLKLWKWAVILGLLVWAGVHVVDDFKTRVTAAYAKQERKE